MPSSEEARLRRALKALAEHIERMVYVAASSDDVTSLRRIAREARAALAETPSDPRGG